MRKTPTAFDRDWDGDRSRVVNAPHKDCGWVFAGEDIATRKQRPWRLGLYSWDEP